MCSLFLQEVSRLVEEEHKAELIDIRSGPNIPKEIDSVKKQTRLVVSFPVPIPAFTTLDMPEDESNLRKFSLVINIYTL